MKSEALDIYTISPAGVEARNSENLSESYYEILDAAADCFKENGFAATSIDDVARMLGATKGMIYHHFRSKIDLFFAVYRRGMELNFNAIDPYCNDLSNREQPIEQLANIGIAHAIALMANQPYQRVLAQGVEMHQTGSTTAAQRETLVELIKLRNTYEAHFRKAINAACDNKYPADEFSIASKNFLAVLNGTVFWYSPRDDNAEEEQIAMAIDLVRFAIQGLGLSMPTVTIKEWKSNNE